MIIRSIKKLLTRKGFSYKLDKAKNRWVCTHEDAYGVVFHVFKTKAEVVEITSLHSLYVTDDFLMEAKDIIDETNRNISLGSFHINTTGYITFSTSYKLGNESETVIDEVCEEIFNAGIGCRQAIFENMLCEIDEW